MNGEFNTIANDLLPAIYQRWGRVEAVVAELHLPTARAFVFVVCDDSNSSYRVDVDIEIANSPGIFAPAMTRELEEIITSIGGLNAFQERLIASAMPVTVPLDEDCDCDEWELGQCLRSAAAYH